MSRTHKTRFYLLTAVAVLAALLPIGASSGRHLHAQTPATVKNQPYVPQWQVDAGGDVRFEVASVKRDAPGAPWHQNVHMTADDNFTPTGGLLSANGALFNFVIFAYKLKAYGYYSLLSQLPKLPKGPFTSYDIEARTPGNPTKDQYRLMMQALLADRFKLMAHWEMKQIPVMAVVLEKPGKLGPRIRPHSDDVSCPAGQTPSDGRNQKMVAGSFPEFCGIAWYWSDSGRLHRAARNVPISAMTDYFMNGPADRPYVDRTGLKGNYDIALEWSLQPGEFGYQPDDNGPSFVEALKNQLGFKLIPETAPIETLVIDHVEQPSPN